MLRALGLGDFLTAVPAYRGLRRAFPDARITLAAPAAVAPLVPLTGSIDELSPTPGLGHRELLHPPPDLAVNLHGSGPQSIDDLLATGARQLLSHRHRERPDVPGPDWLSEQHEVWRWCRLLTSAGIDADPRDLRLSVPDRSDLVGAMGGAVVVHPGAAAESRRWPADRYAAVVAQLRSAGHRVVLTGGPSEAVLTAEVIDRAGLSGDRGLDDLAGRLDLADLAALIAASRLLVCGDTGVAHLASAYATPSVLLFGPTSPLRWGPPDGGPHTVLWAGREGDPHGGRPDPGLLGIDVPSVLAAVDGRLS